MTADHHQGRNAILDSLTRELFGPDPRGEPIALDPPPAFPDEQSAYGPWVNAADSDEIISRDRPTKRYGVGVLYPAMTAFVDANEPSKDDADPAPAPPDEAKASESGFGDDIRGGGDADSDDFDLTATSQYKPSAMAVSCLVLITPGDRLVLNASGARYEPVTVTVAGKARQWWRRVRVSIAAEFDLPALPVAGPVRVRPSSISHDDFPAITADLLCRQHGDALLITAALVNNSPGGASADTASLFQTAFSIEIRNGEKLVPAFGPYPDRRTERLLARDEEARSLALLYRKGATFAIGHGCAAGWPEGWGAAKATKITADALPSFETPSITPDITLSDGRSLAVPMGPLAGLDSENDGSASLDSVLASYAEWIDKLSAVASDLVGYEHQAALEHIAQCRTALARMRDGAAWIRSDATASRAFRLANLAVLTQQLRTNDTARRTVLAADGRFSVGPSDVVPDWRTAKGRGSWRAFQIGFLLSAIKSSALGDDPDRETVELIFFPTGGGKTEAYQALAAFGLIYHRLIGRSTGVSVLMRYTLRLLTAQQFQRAAGLITALDRIRVEHGLGGDEFSIGIWVGGSTTPNTRTQALDAYSELVRSEKSTNPFLLLRCPWCAAQMGPIDAEPKAPKNVPRLAGYRRKGGTIQLHCPDRKCPFSERLPVSVIDDEIYDNRPSLIIGTVDKFAMLAFKPNARSIFGLEPDGSRSADPPNLVIQDELHLISGPLGSMVGLYEGIIEDLCTDYRNGGRVRPKIIASTATIRRYKEQITALYGRESVALFPPPGLDADDSFFARYATNDDGTLAPGRRYVGVHAPGLGSIQTAQVRTSAALLQAARDLPADQRDPWSTLVTFFNSLRELGTSVSLFQSDIPDYLLALRNRRGTPPSEMRYLRHMLELTSRLRQDEIPVAITKLERPVDGDDPVDVCLASSIIEVGIDISRLSLMCIVGQPKTTSQYIQVSGRVGRRWAERPGLVVTIYGASKPRDRSHFERFRSYHQRLYAEVEPVSVTPFAPPVLQRAYHAALVAYARQAGSENLQPWPIPSNLVDRAVQILAERAGIADPEEAAAVKAIAARRQAEWTLWERNSWEFNDGTNTAPLLHRAGQWVPATIASMSWPTPMSMREVDAECQGAVTTLYARDAADAQGVNP